MLRLSSRQYIEARARRFRIVPVVNVVSVVGLEPPKIPVEDDLHPQEDGLQEDRRSEVQADAHPFFWKELGQRTPSEIRWIWNPQTGDLHVGIQGRHAGMSPQGTDPESVLRGFYLPSTKTVAIRPYYWADGDYDQWDEGHAELSADIQSAFIAGIQATLQQQEPEVQFRINIGNDWLQRTTGRGRW